MSLLTLARDLRRRKARERQGLFVAEGIRGVEELLRSAVSVKGVLVSAELSQNPRGQALLKQLQEARLALEEVAPAEFTSAADTETPQGVLAIAAVPEARLAD